MSNCENVRQVGEEEVQEQGDAQEVRIGGEKEASQEIRSVQFRAEEGKWK